MASRGWLVAAGLGIAALACTSTETDKGKVKKSSTRVEVEKSTGEPLDTGPVSPVALAADDNFLYWTNATAKSGTLMRGSHDAKQLGFLAKDEPGSSLIALDDKYVYWRVTQGFLRTAKEGGTKEPMAVWEDSPPNIAAFDGKLYFSDDKTGSIMVATPDNKANVFAKGLKGPGEVAADGVSVYWFAAGAADGAGKPGKIMRAPRAGGDPVVLAEGEEGATGLTLDDLAVYWVVPAEGGSVRSVGKGGGAVTVVAKGLGDVKKVHSDNKFVYLASGKAIRRVPAKGGEVTLVTTVPGSVGGIVTDAQFVYWNDYGGGKLFRAPKP